MNDFALFGNALVFATVAFLVVTEGFPKHGHEIFFLIILLITTLLSFIAIWTNKRKVSEEDQREIDKWYEE